MKQFWINPVCKTINPGISKGCMFLIILLISGAITSMAQETTCANRQNTGKRQALITPSASSSFSANLKADGKVVLNWTTPAGANNSHFIMQRSSDGSEFNDAALLFATEGSQQTSISYHYSDNIDQVMVKRIYYRIKMVDAEGKITYTAPLQVSLEKTKGQKENTSFYPSI
jgi:hypothetical protein